MNNEEIPLFRWNTKTKEFYVLGHKFDGVNSIEDFIDYITNLDKENKKYKEIVDKANKKLNNFIECCKAEKLESGSDYLHHQYWDMFERFNKQIKDILKEVE